MGLDAPYPYFGGKQAAAPIIWAALGDVPSYVEPFAGSAAVLLCRPEDHKGSRELINDADGFVSNFWRAIKHDPAATAGWCDWPVTERDLAARHHWLITQGRERLTTLEGDPEAYCPQVAGWWCWGLCAWIGSGWCSSNGPWVWDGAAWVKVAQGVNRKMPNVSPQGRRGINRQMPGVSPQGRNGINRQMPAGSHAGQGTNRKNINIYGWFDTLAARLRRVSVLHGDWKRAVKSPSILGITQYTHAGVFLDPPYDTTVRHSRLYAHDTPGVAKDVRDWCLANGANPRLRIVLAGYDNEGHAAPLTQAGWRQTAGKSMRGGGYANQSGDNKNTKRETLWLSPACLGGTMADYLSAYDADVIALGGEPLGL